jgi:hypothetical protein
VDAAYPGNERNIVDEPARVPRPDGTRSEGDAPRTGDDRMESVGGSGGPSGGVTEVDENGVRKLIEEWLLT